MALEQVNVQELQRLGDAINMTMEAIRRVAPQIALLQQQTNPYGTQQGLGTAGVFGAQPWGTPQFGFQPQYGQQLYPQQPQQFGVPFFGGGHGGQIDPISAAYLHGHIQGVRSVLSQIGVGGGGPQQGFGPQQFVSPFLGQQPTPWLGVQRPF